jgi:hypothetical protein
MCACENYYLGGWFGSFVPEDSVLLMLQRPAVLFARDCVPRAEPSASFSQVKGNQIITGKIM